MRGRGDYIFSFTDGTVTLIIVTDDVTHLELRVVKLLFLPGHVVYHYTRKQITTVLYSITLPKLHWPYKQQGCIKYDSYMKFETGVCIPFLALH